MNKDGKIDGHEESLTWFSCEFTYLFIDGKGFSGAEIH